MATTKVCTKCNEEKEIALMAKKESICKNCDCIRSKKYREANRDKVAQKKRGYYEKHKEEINQKWREYYEENKEELCQKVKEYIKTHKEEKAARDKKYAENHKEEIAARNKKYYLQNRDSLISKSNEHYANNREECIKRSTARGRERYAEDPIFRLVCNLRSRVKNAIKSDAGEKAAGTIELLGCTIQDVRIFLETKFQPGMSWDNYGEWHIDHIKPCAKFNLQDPEEQRKCFHWTNLQPLWAADNLSKGDRLDWVKT